MEPPRSPTFDLPRPSAGGTNDSSPELRPVALALLVALVTTGCGVGVRTPGLHSADELPALTARDDFLKVHTHDGELYVLTTWGDPTPDGGIEGTGTRYDLDREPVSSGSFTIGGADIALLEVSDPGFVAGFATFGLSVVTGFMTGLTFSCIADPKSCFGSCPTFYVAEDSDRPVAEGFSSSFARVLEERDVDHLGLAAPPGPLSLLMRNEALETHAVRHVELLAVPKHDGRSALLTTSGASGSPVGEGSSPPAEIVWTGAPKAPVRCRAGGVDCLPEVRARDDTEYTSVTDAKDLAAREEVVLDFGRVSGQVGLVLTARNSFVTTYVFYQSLAYAGGQAGDLLAALERGEPGVQERVLGVQRALGGVEVHADVDGREWRLVGEFDEAGPIAADRQVVTLGAVETDDLKIKLRMARGSWRIDEVALVEVVGQAAPVVLEPDSVTEVGPTPRDRDGLDPRVFDRLADPSRHLVTVPGDTYRIWFTVPDGGEYDLFLDTSGYYYEWIREEWLEEESSERTAELLLSPEEALKSMAPGFKEIEPRMERLFWSSRFRR